MMYASEISKEEIMHLPVYRFPGEIHVINNLDDFGRVIPLLRSLPLLGFDTETKPNFKKGRSNQVALLQLSGKDHAFLFQLQRIGLPDELIEILANPNVTKVGAAIRDDIIKLRGVRDFTPGGFVELQEYVKQYNIGSNGLVKITAIVLKMRISKSQQLTNWENDNLTESQLSYAATDAWACYEIYNELIKNHQNPHGQICQYNP
jgi:ribonuclease D